MPHAPPWSPYRPPDATYDEAIDPAGRWRPHVAQALSAVGRAELAALTDAIGERARAGGMTFPTESGGDELFVVDPVPRVLDAAEWNVVARGVAQRTRALNAFVADVHGPRRAVAEGVVPERVIEGAEHHHPAAARLAPPGGVWIGVAGLDLVRGPDGRFRVLEDNVRTPSGIAYAMAARAVTRETLGLDAVPARPVDGAVELLRATLTAAAPGAPADPLLVVLTDGPASSAYFEHRVLAERLGAPLITTADLALRGDRLVLREAPQRPVDAVYRRTDSSTPHDPALRDVAAALGAGTVGVVNGFGTGVADDKLIHAYVEDLIRFHLGEEPILHSVRTFDLERADDREEALDRLGELVVKPRGGSGGADVVIGPQADEATLARLRRAITETPEAHVAQERVELSTAPTVVDGALQPRHVDLRPFGFLTAPGEAHVLPGGLTRVALPAGSMVVNSSQDGGVKDTWVLP